MNAELEENQRKNNVSMDILIAETEKLRNDLKTVRDALKRIHTEMIRRGWSITSFPVVAARNALNETSEV